MIYKKEQKANKETKQNKEHKTNKSLRNKVFSARFRCEIVGIHEVYWGLIILKDKRFINIHIVLKFFKIGILLHGYQFVHDFLPLIYSHNYEHH